MTYCSVYIGDLDDPNFDITASGPVGNTPRALTKSFPAEGEHYNALFHRWIKDRQITCVETDYSAYVARVTKAQIADYVDYAYGSNESYTDPDCMLRWEGRPYLVDKLEKIKAFIASLDNEKLYALVAECD